MMKSSHKRRIILDTDPGGDDILALFWLLSLVKRGLAELVAVTTAAGNVSALRTFTNASQILHLLRYDAITVGRGVVPDVVPEDASHIHGNDGMGNLSASLPAATHVFAAAPAADDLIIEHLMATSGEITLVAIGPLTNLAAAEMKCPGILQRARDIVVMGGAFYCPGNVTSQAEFNIWFNPAAAETVFQSRSDIVVLPLDVTTRLRLTPAMMATVVSTNSMANSSRFLTQLCDFMVSTALGYRETGTLPAFLVHDAAAIGALFYSEMFSFKRGEVHIETQGVWTQGQTVLSDRRLATMSMNAWIALEVDESLFFTNFLADLQAFLQTL